jgi:O-antigen ligase
MTGAEFFPSGQARATFARSHPQRLQRRRVESSYEQESIWRDLLFAVTSVSILCGIKLPGVELPVFVLFAVVVAAMSVNTLRHSPYIKYALVPPLLIFLIIHLAFAFRISMRNGAIFVFQAATDGMFVLCFLNRYCQVSMRRYLHLTGLGMGMLLAVVVGYHIVHHQFVSWKRLAHPKAVFDLLPVMLLVLRRTRSKTSQRLFAVLVPIFLVCILLSGERKAYILLALLAPLLINFRSPLTYLMPFILAFVLSAGLSLDRAGYVSRQIDTLGRLAEGNASHTISDDMRTWAVNHAKQKFLQNPVIGVGTNGYGLDIGPELNVNLAPHNEWLRVAAENGILGLIFYSATVMWGFVGLIRTRVGPRVRTLDEKFVALALILTFVIYLSFEALDFIVIMSFLFTPFVQYLRLDPNDCAPALRSGRVVTPFHDASRDTSPRAFSDVPANV